MFFFYFKERQYKANSRLENDNGAVVKIDGQHYGRLSWVESYPPVLNGYKKLTPREAEGSTVYSAQRV